MTRRMPTVRDVLHACFERLSGADFERLTGEFKTVAGALDEVGRPDFTEDDPATIELMSIIRRPDDRRSPWGHLIALVAVLSHRRGDTAGFWRAGHEVLTLQEQTHRAKRRQESDDALNAWIDAYLTEHPGTATSQVLDEIIEQVGVYPAFADYDPVSGVLTYQPRANSESLRDINMQTARRRIQRVRQQPAGVVGLP